ncbi:MAG: tetratricopeptide repeat protein [Bacteroidales bacterium]|nr:tetratricopeptide repeat protein [Bacteroidales bacterium]
MRKLSLVILFFIFGSLINVSAQDIEAAADAYNQAIGFTQAGNHTEALKLYQKTIELSEELGDEGMELLIRAEQQLPSTFFNVGKGLYEDKKLNEAIPYFEESVKYADQMGESRTADASRTYLAGIFTAQGNADLRADALDKAIENYNKAIRNKPDFARAYYGLGLVYRKQGNNEEMKQAMDRVLELSPAGDRMAENARSTVATAFLNEGAVALQRNAFDSAIESLSISAEYNENEPLAFYYLALAYNGKKDWDAAIDAAGKAIALGYENTGDAWFEIGKSNEGKGNADAACEAYKKVSSGNNVAAAKYQVEQVLKCN